MQYLPLLVAGAIAGVAPITGKPILALGISLGLAVALLTFMKPDVGFFLVVLTIPLEAAGKLLPMTATLPLTIPKVLTLLTVVAWLSHLAFRKVSYRQLSWMYLIVGFWFTAALSLVGADELRSGYEAMFRFTTTIIFFFLVVQMIRSVRSLKIYLTVFLIATTVASSYAVIQRFMPMGSFEFRAGWEEESSKSFGVEKDIVERHMVGIVERSTGTTIHPGLLTFNVCLVLAPIVVMMINTHPRDILRRFWWVVAIGILISALVVSYSRAGFLMLAGTFLLMLLLGVIRLGIVQLTVLTLVVILTTGLAPAKYLDRVLSSESYTTRSRSIATRLEVLEAAVDQFMDHPVLGVGYGNRYGIFHYYTTYPDKKHAVSPHNAYVQMAAQVGLVGLSFLLIFFWKIHAHLRRAIRLFRYRGEIDLQRLGNALYISFVVFLVEGFIADLFDKGLPQVWLLIGMIAAYIYLARESSEQVSHAIGTT